MAKTEVHPPLRRAFGLTFRSALPLPELALAGIDVADVEITFESVPERLEGASPLEPCMQVLPDVLQFNTPAARYRVREGRQIAIEPHSGATEADIRLYLLGTVMGALCHQRGLLALHATALNWSSGAVIVAGPSGAGKSTLAAQHHARGGGVLTDDLCVLDLNPGRPTMVYPGPRRLKLWDDSPALDAWPVRARSRLAQGVDKFSMPLAAAAGRAPLALLVLRPRERNDWDGEAAPPAITVMAGPEAVGALVSHVFRLPLAIAMGRSTDVFSQAVLLAGGLPVHEVRYVHDPERPLKLLDAMSNHLAGG